MACDWWNREPQNSLRGNLNWNNGQTDDVAKPSGDASNVMCDLHTASDMVYKEKAITGTGAVPHTYFVLWIITG
jgi:hypothetical protein